MPILKIKPHKLEYLTQSDGYRDELGDWHEGQSKWLFLGDCDAVPAGAANEITLPDGVVTTYSYVVYLKPCDHDFKVGEKVRIKFFGKEPPPDKAEFQVKGYHVYQHQCKIWI